MTSLPDKSDSAEVTKRASSIADVTKRPGRPRLLDLYCGEGGAGAGYWLAGFDVVGVDNRPQPRYPFEFHQADVLEFLDAGGGVGFDAIHASAPCQLFSCMLALARASGSRKVHPNLIAPTRDRLRVIGLPYVLENVPGAPLEEPVRLCGSSFGLDLRRHRLFECSIPLLVPPCAHGWQVPKFEVRIGQPNSRSGGKDRINLLSAVVTVVGNSVIADEARRAMGMPWATRDGCSQAIPPAYTQLIGAQLLAAAGASRNVSSSRDVEDLVRRRPFRDSHEVLALSRAGSCSWCGGLLEHASTGRRRRTCSDRCRQARKRSFSGAFGENQRHIGD